MQRLWMVAMLLTLSAGCASGRPATTLPATPARQVAGRREAKQEQQGRLRVSHVNLIAHGSTVRVHANVENAYPAKVEGLRYVVTVYTERAGAKPLTTYRYEDNTALEPGERKVVSFDLDGVDLGASGESRYAVNAAPKKVGDHEFLPPAGWKP